LHACGYDVDETRSLNADTLKATDRETMGYSGAAVMANQYNRGFGSGRAGYMSSNFGLEGRYKGVADRELVVLWDWWAGAVAG
jgi:hypothetical protein